MVTRLPHGLQKLLEVTVGMPWPEGSEHGLWELAGAWQQFADELAVLGDGLLAEGANFAEVIQGATGDSIHTLLSKDFHDGADQLKEQAEAYSKMLKNAAADIQKTRIMILGMLVVLAATIASLLSSLFGSFLVPSVVAAARVGIGLALRSLLTKLAEIGLAKMARELAMKTLIGAVVGAGLMVGLDASIQAVQIAKGHRQGMDTKSLKGSAIGGAIAGAMAGAATGVVGIAAKAGRDLWRILPKSVRAFGPLADTFLQIPTAALSNPVINAATHSPGSAMDGILGALDSGGGHSHAHVPGGSVRSLAPLRTLDLSRIRTLAASEMSPVTAADGTQTGTAFTTVPTVPTAPVPAVENGRSARGTKQAPPDTTRAQVPAGGRTTTQRDEEGRGHERQAAESVRGKSSTESHVVEPVALAETHHGEPVAGGRGVGGAERSTASEGAGLGSNKSRPPAEGGSGASAHGGEAAGRAERLAATGKASSAGKATGTGGHASDVGSRHQVETAGQPHTVGGRTAAGQGPGVGAPAQESSVRTHGTGEDGRTESGHADAVGRGADASQGRGVDTPGAGADQRPGVGRAEAVGRGAKETSLSRFLGEGQSSAKQPEIRVEAEGQQPLRGVDAVNRPQTVDAGDVRAEPARTDGSGGAAHDFKRAPGTDFGDRQPVAEATHQAMVSPQPAASGGSWHKPGQAGESTVEHAAERGPVVQQTRFVSSTQGAEVLRGMHTSSGEIRSLPAHEGEVRELVAGERRVGMSLRSDVDSPHLPVTSSRRPVFQAPPGVAREAGEFQGVLARAFGHREPVPGPHEGDWTVRAAEPRPLVRTESSGRLELPAPEHRRADETSLRMSGVDTAADMMVREETPGLTPPRSTDAVEERLQLAGRLGHQRIQFFADEVTFAPLEREGRVIGVTFAVGELREFARRWADQSADLNLTAVAKAGDTDYLSAGAVTLQRAPWPDNAMFVAGHADAAGFAVELTDGTRVSVGGEVLAGLAGQLAVFRGAVYAHRPEAFVLIACATGAGNRGAAQRFQRTLAERFGGDFDRPVVAPSTTVQAVISPRVATMVAGGGTWQTFATGLAPVLGVDEAGRAAYVRAADVFAPAAVAVDRWRVLKTGAVPARREDRLWPSGPAEARSFPLDGPSADWRERAGRDAEEAAERARARAAEAAERMRERAAGAAERLYRTTRDEPSPAEPESWPEPATPEVFGPAGPAERLHRARIDRPKVEGEVDGAGLRAAIAHLLGGKTVGASTLRKLVDQAFSDDNLKKDFERTLEGGVVVDFGAGGKGKQVTIEAVALSSPRASSTTTGSVSREHVVPVRQRLHAVRAAVNTEPRAIRVPLPFVMLAGKLAGLVNLRGSELRSTTNSEAKTKVSESDIESTTAQHDLTYRITVRKPGRYPWSKPVVQVGYHDVKTGLSWPEYPAAAVQAESAPVRPDAVAHTELSGLGQVYQAVVTANEAAAATDPETRRFREWLDRLPARGHELFGGEPVRESFGFGGKAPVEVVVAIAAKSGERLAEVEGSVTETRKLAVEHLSSQSYTRRWGTSVTVGVGDFTHVLGGYAGIVATTYRNTKTGTARIDEHGQELSAVYKGRLGKQRVEVDYLVRVGDTPAVTVPGTATVWTKPEETAAPAAADPPGADRYAVPDRVDTRFRLPEPVVADIVGRVLHRLDATGLLKGKHLARLNERFRTFLADHAKEVVQGGDGVRFPLSAWHKGAPDVFVRGVLHAETGTYLGVAKAETLDGKVSLGHTHTVELSKGVDRSRGVVGNLYQSKPVAKAVNLQITRERNQRDTGKSEQHVGAEKSLTSTEPVHRFSYPAEFEVRAGGRWSAPGEVLHWRDLGDTAGYPVAKIDGHVEVATAGRPGEVFDRGPARDEAAVWHEDDAIRPDLRTGTLPPGFALESLKPVPHLLGTTAAMMSAPAGIRWGGWLSKTSRGSLPPEVDQHKARGTYEREAGEQDERNVALDELETFAAPTARIARFERVALFHDTVRLKSYNQPGLMGSRELVARIDLSARMGNPRLLGRDEAHTFKHSGKARTNREAKAETGTGFKARLTVLQAAPLGKVFSAGAELSVGGGHVHTDGVLKVDGTSVTDRGDRVERGYLVGFDATYEAKTAARHNWGDMVGLWHDGPAREEAKWIHLPDAVKIWVPAGEIHRVGELTGADVAKLESAEAELYRAEQAKSAESPRQDEPAEPEEHAGDVRAPGNVGRGAGTVELYRLEAGAELVRQVSQRVEAWADEYRGPVADPVDVGYQALVKPARDLPPTPFDPINDRLVHDVLGPMLTGAVADSALREMLTGGRSVFLEGETPFGKVEQLVILRAELGEGRYHGTLTASAGSVEVEATRTAGVIDQHRWARDFGLNSLSTVSRDHRPGSMLTAGLNYMRRLTDTTEISHEHKDTVTAEHSGAAVQFVHDLRVTMEVHPYARLGHYSKHLPTWFPTPGPRAVDAPWRSEFELPGAVRSTVPVEDTVPLGGEPRLPVEEVDGSLRDWQRLGGRRNGLATEAVVQVRPFAAPGLHAALNALVSGADGRPPLRPRAGYQLRSATESGPLRTNVRDLLSAEGYVIPVSGDAVAHVRVTADLVHRELVRVLDGAPLKLDVNGKQTVKMTSDLKGELGLSYAVDIRAVNAGTERGRPAFMISDATTPLVPWADYNTTSVSTKQSEPARKTDGEQRYLVRITPVWELRAAYRAKKAPDGWTAPIRTEPDEPILIEVDRQGLESLGLHDPGLPTPIPASPLVRRGSGNDQLSSLGDYTFRRTRSRLRSEDSLPGWAFSRSFVSSARGLEPGAPVRVPNPVKVRAAELAGLTDVHELRSFTAAEVQMHPLTRRGHTIGVTFLVGEERRFDVNWAKGLVPDIRREGAPWPGDSFFVSVHGQPETVAVHLADGTRLHVSGTTLAQVLMTAKPFRRAMTAADARLAIAMMVCKAGAQAGEGGVAHDFQRTLEAEFGYRRPVVAPTEDVHLITGSPFAKIKSLSAVAPGREPSMTRVIEGGHWRTFPGGNARPVSLRDFLTTGGPPTG